MAETTNDTVAGAVAALTSDKVDSGVTPATTFSTSGAPVQIVPNVDASHPAVDNDPRANTTPLMNRIDFNDPRPTAVIAAEAADTKAKTKT